MGKARTIMTENNTTEKITATLVPIYPFPNWKGETTFSRLKIASPGNFKPELHIPVPSNDEECTKVYGMTLMQLIAKGARQQVYDCSEPIRVWFQSQVNAGKDVNEIKDVPPANLFIKEIREKKSSEAKLAKAVLDKHAMTAADLDAKLARLAQLEAAQAGVKKSRK